LTNIVNNAVRQVISDSGKGIDLIDKIPAQELPPLEPEGLADYQLSATLIK
uniref:Uncharacterized protein n=1 Tax=Amphimedon queenslandica TaxID=400682 RepID=A0A1X7VHK2_AMPQE